MDYPLFNYHGYSVGIREVKKKIKAKDALAKQMANKAIGLEVFR